MGSMKSVVLVDGWAEDGDEGKWLLRRRNRVVAFCVMFCLLLGGFFCCSYREHGDAGAGPEQGAMAEEEGSGQMMGDVLLPVLDGASESENETFNSYTLTDAPSDEETLPPRKRAWPWLW